VPSLRFISPSQRTGHSGQRFPLVSAISTSRYVSSFLPSFLCLMLLRKNDATKNRALCRQETRMEIDLLGTKTINKSDVIQSLRNVSALATLYQSLVRLSNVPGDRLCLLLLLDLAQASVGRAQVDVRGSDVSYPGGCFLSLPFHSYLTKTHGSTAAASATPQFVAKSVATST
jgi:hypothetical protein